MRSKAPPSFEASFIGSGGRYEIAYEPTDDWEGRIETTIDGVSMVWPVDNVEKDDVLHLCGLTHGSQEIWGDIFWFELIVDGSPKLIRYWGDQVISHEDPIEMH